MRMIILPHQTSERPNDWSYMEESEKVLNNPPQTWRAYPDSKEGRLGIINMEYQELQNAIVAGKSNEEIMKELVHLGTATLHYWRLLHAPERQ